MNQKELNLLSEDSERFKAKLKDIAFPCYKLLHDNCKYEKNLSSEELSYLKTLITIQKADKGNTVVLMDKEKYKGVKNVMSDSSIPLHIPVEYYG